jgi:hypothetical protein
MPKYIYESPDGGKTVYRYPVGQYEKRELIGSEVEVLVDREGIVTIYDTTGDPGTDSSAREQNQ